MISVPELPLSDLPSTDRRLSATALMTFLLILFGVAALLAGPMANPATAAPVPVTVSITSITQMTGDLDPGPTGSPADFYAGVTIGGPLPRVPDQDNFDDRLDNPFEFGVGHTYPRRTTLNPPWTFTDTVDDGDGSPIVAIELWDNDDCDEPFCVDDDRVDISPTDGETLDLTVNLADAKWTGDVNWPQNCAEGTGGQAVRICFEISTVSSSGDADGDSLLDAWEQHGFNGDGNATTDVNLPALGADPRREDLFVEIDCLVSDGNSDGDMADLIDHSHCPRQNAMTDVIQGFADAPRGNPDGTNGVQLHLDTGTLFGPGLISVMGVGGVTGNVGDMGGGGSQIAEAGNTIIDWDGNDGRNGTDFHNLKNSNFDSARRDQIFRYSIFGHQTNARAAVNDCTSGWAEGIQGNDFMVTLGGRRDLDGDGTPDMSCWGETAADSIDNDGDSATDEDPAGGGDGDGDCVPGTDTDGDGTACVFGDVGVDEDGGHSIGSRGQQAGTFMHEFGHTLGLQHGGNDGLNRKPNYLSVMNYAFQSCVVPASPGPALAIPGGCDYSRVVVNLNEQLPPGLDECVGLGPALGFGSNDWDGDGTLEGATNCQPPNNANVQANINRDSNPDPNGNGLFDPGETPVFSNLPGFNDWNNLFFNFQGLANFGDDGPIHPVENEPDPETIEDAQRWLRELLAPDVELTLDGPATAVPGETLGYRAEAANRGRGPALDLTLTATRPDASTATFSVGGLTVGENQTRTVNYSVPSNACPSTLRVGAEASFVDFVSTPLTASASTSTRVLDVRPPAIDVSVSPTSLRPPNHKLVNVNAAVSASDECDPNPRVRLVSVTSSEPDNGVADGDTTGDIAGAAAGTDDRSFQVRAERAGTGRGRTYTVVYEAEDASGNTARGSTTIRVPH